METIIILCGTSKGKRVEYKQVKKHVRGCWRLLIVFQPLLRWKTGKNSIENDEPHTTQGQP